jgi:hypothetical protein
VRRIYTALTVWYLVALVTAGTLGVLGERVGERAHALAGLFAAFFGCLVPSLLIVHFIGSMKWIQQTGVAAALPDTKRLRTAWVRGPAFPSLVVMALLAVAAAISGAHAQGTVGAAVHVVLAAASAASALVTLRWARRAIDENAERMREVGERADALRRAGAVREEPADVLLPESGRAGGKVLLWLSGNVWLLYAYRVWVLRGDDPVWPYGAACVVLGLLGLGLLRASQQA